MTADGAIETPADAPVSEAPAFFPMPHEKRHTAPDAPVVTLPEGHLAAWLGLWLVNASFALVRPWPAAGASVRALHVAFDLGNALALGLLGWLSLTLFARLVSRRRRWLILAVAISSIAVSTVTLVDDIESFLAGRDLEDFRYPVAAAISLGVPGAAAVGGFLARPFLRLVPIAGAIGAAIANHLVLASDYPAAHLYIAWGATTLGSWALVGVPRPDWIGRAFRRRAAVAGATTLATCGALVSLVVWPRPTVVVDMFQSEGAVLFPYLAEIRSDDEPPSTEEPKGEPKGPRFIHADWRQPRLDQPDIPPSEPRLAPARPIVILLSIDSMRAETLVVPQLRGRLPHMTRIADEGIHFTRARATGSSTRNTLGSLFASKHRSALSWKVAKGLGSNLKAEASPRLSEMLEAEGLTTAHVASYAPLGNRSRILGRFQEEEVVRTEVKGQRFALSHELLDVAIPLIESRKDEPLFLFMHWMDAHAPYDAVGTQGGKLESYLRELELCDTQVGRLREALERMGVIERVVFVLIADHGEALGEHGIPEHGISLYDVLVRVPIVFHLPGLTPRRVDTPVSTLDIAPTLLDLVGAPTPGAWLGQSLVGFLRGETPRLDRPIVGDQNAVTSLVVDDIKVMTDSRKNVVEVYDLANDPRELHNLADPADEEQQALLSELRSFLASHRVTAKTKKRVD